jgi:hypothetical protein
VDDGDSGFSWSPDGSLLAVVVAHPKDGGLWIVNSDGSGSRRIGLQGSRLRGAPTWSSDGTMLGLFSEGATGDPTKTSVSVVGLDGRERWRFPGKASPGYDCFARDPAFAPVGNQLAFIGYCEPSYPGGVYVIDVK